MKTIGIVGRAYYNKDNQEIIQFNEHIRKCFSSYDDVSIIGILPPEDIYYVETEMGADILTEKTKRKLDAVLNKCDGFLIPGGTYWYNFDEYIMSYAISNDKPLLGICLGFQALCSMHAKNRRNFDRTEKLNSENHYGNSSQYIHNINIKKDTKLYEILREETIPVNSVHHDIVNFEMNDLIVSSKSEDGVIESVELSDKKFIIGLQWHPEYLMDSYSKKILDSFIKAL